MLGLVMIEDDLLVQVVDLHRKKSPGVVEGLDQSIDLGPRGVEVERGTGRGLDPEALVQRPGAVVAARTAIPRASSSWLTSCGWIGDPSPRSW